jgi:hypothetical protein
LVDELAEDEIRIHSPVQHQRQEQQQQHLFMGNQQQQQSLSMKRPADDSIHHSSSYNDIPDNSYDSAEEEFREFVTTPKKRRKTKKNQKKKSKGSEDGLGDENDDDDEEEEEEGGDGDDDENGSGAIVDDEYEQYLKRADPPDLLAQLYMNSLTPTNNVGNTNSDGFAGMQHHPIELHHGNDHYQNQYHQIPQHQQYQQYQQPQPQQPQSFLLNEHLRSASATATTAYYPDQRQAFQQPLPPSYHNPLPLPSLHGFPSFTHQQQLPQHQSQLQSPFTNHNTHPHQQHSNPFGYNSATMSSQNPFEQGQSYYGSNVRHGSHPISLMSPSTKTYNENTNQSVPPLLFSSSSTHSSNYPTFPNSNSSHSRQQNYSFGHTSSLNISSSSSDNQPQLPQVIHASLLVRIPSRKPTFFKEENQQTNNLVVIDVEEEEKKNNEEQREEEKGRITGEETFRLSERFSNEMGLAPEMTEEKNGIQPILQNSHRFGQESEQNVFITQPRAPALMFHNNIQQQSPYFSSQPTSQQAQQIQQHHQSPNYEQPTTSANHEEQDGEEGEEEETEENQDSSSDDTIPIALKRKRQLPSNLQSSSTFHS